MDIQVFHITQKACFGFVLLGSAAEAQDLQPHLTLALNQVEPSLVD